MRGLKNAQAQLLNADTGEFIEDVNMVSDATCVTYSNDTPTVSAHGGIPAGTTFDNVPLQKVIDDLLYPYTKPTISLKASEAAGVKEKGVSLSDILLTATIGKKSENIKKVEFMNGSTVIGTISSPKAAGGQETFTYDGPIKDAATLKAKVTDAKDGSAESNGISYSFVYPIYIGALDAGMSVPTGDQIIAALEKRVVAKATQQYKYTITDKRMCIACPPGMTLSKITDPNGFDSTAAFNKISASVKGLDGTSQNYTVYVGGVTSQNDYTMTFAI